MNSKFEKVVRELRAKFRGGELHAKLGGGVLPWGRWFSRLWGVIRGLGRIVWPHLRLTLMKGVGRDQGFWVVEQYEGVGRDQGFWAPELCAAWAIGIE